MKRVYKPNGASNTSLISIENGGTAARNAAEAAAKLELVTNADANKPLGPVLLDENKVIPSRFFPNELSLKNNAAVKGDFITFTNRVSKFVITNFDAKAAYVLSADGGTITRDGEDLTFTAGPDERMASFTIDGERFDVDIWKERVQAPSILSPGNYAYFKGGDTATLIATDFVANSEEMLHKSTDWQVAEDPDFTTLSTERNADAINKTSWTLSLEENKKYYVRVRYRDLNDVVSEWSPTLYFSTIKVLYQTNKFYPADAAAGDDYGASMSMDDAGDFVAVGAPGSGGKGAVYLLIRTGSYWTQLKKLVASDGAEGDLFGSSVSLNEAGSRLVVGAPGANDGKGAVYIFFRQAGEWIQQSRLIASDGAATDRFGSSVSMTGTGASFVAGAPGVASAKGAAYLFMLSGAIWVQQSRLVAADGAAGESFGSSVALAHDGEMVFVAATKDDDRGADSGSVYVFTRSGSIWSQQAKIVAADGMIGDGFGHAMTLNQSATTLAVSAPYTEDGATRDVGATYLFTRDGTVWTQSAKIKPIPGLAYAKFGSSLSLNNVGDVLLIGSQLNDDANTDNGCAYVYVKDNTTWSLHTRLLGTDRTDSDNFGSSCCLNGLGDVAVVGAFKDDTVVASGSCYSFEVFKSRFPSIEITKLSSEDLENYSYLGSKTAINASGNRIAIANNDSIQSVVYVYEKDGDRWDVIGTLSVDGVKIGSALSFTADGNKLLIGAKTYDAAGKVRAGGLFTYIWEGTSWNIQSIYTPDAVLADDQFGHDVSISEDGTRAVVTAYGSNPTRYAAYILFSNAGVWEVEERIAASGSTVSDNFAKSADIDATGLTVIVSDHSNELNGPMSGCVHVYTRAESRWTKQTELRSTETVSGDFFGYAVAVSPTGIMIVATAPRRNEPTGRHGAAYVFINRNGVWVQETKLLPSKTTDSLFFGLSCAISAAGETVMIGDLGAGTDHAIVSVYTRARGNWKKKIELEGSNTTYGDGFGSSISLSYDGDLAIIGAPSESLNGKISNGGAYVFKSFYAVPLSPTILSPSNASETVLDVVTLTATPFQSPSGDTHASTNWEVATDPSFSLPSILRRSSNDAINKTSINITGLLSNTNYYARVSYNGAEFFPGIWSSVSTFKTIPTFAPNPPTIMSPTTGATNIGPTLTITSNAFTSPVTDSHATSDWEVSTDPSFVTGVIKNYGSTSKQSWAPTGLLANKTYYVRVRYNGTKHSGGAWSSSVTFNTMAAFTPNKPSITSPVNNVTGVGPDIVITSSAFSGPVADTHLNSDWEIATDSGFANIAKSSYDNATSDKRTWSVTGLSPNTTYYVRVRHAGVTYGEGAWSDAITMKTLASFAPNQPTVNQPLMGQAYGSTAALSSSAFSSPIGSTGHSGSNWQISTDNSFNTYTDSYDGAGNLTTWTAINLEQNKTYYARVRYKNAYGYSVWSNAVSLQTKTSFAPNTPSITYPANNAIDQDKTVTFSTSSFSSPVSDGHVGSDWQLATDAGFNSIVNSVENSAWDKTNWMASGLSVNTTYYVRVRHVGGSGTSNWSSTLTFKTKLNFGPKKPALTFPYAGSNFATRFKMTGNAFVHPSDTHASSTWQIARDNSFLDIVAQTNDDYVNKLSWLVPEGNLNKSTTYYARVRYNGAFSGPSDWSEVVQFTTKAVVAPTKPVITNPSVTNELNVTSPYTFTSSSFVMASGLIANDPPSSHKATDWQLSKNAAFTDLFSSVDKTEDNSNKTSWNVTGLIADTTYYVRVRYYDALAPSEASEWSDVKTIKVKAAAPPAKPYVYSTEWGSMNGDNTVNVHVRGSIYIGEAPHAATDWECSTNPSFTSGMIWNGYNDTVNKDYWWITNLAQGTTYYFRIRYYDNTGKVSQWSDGQMFTT